MRKITIFEYSNLKTYSKIIFGILLIFEFSLAQDSTRSSAGFGNVVPRKFFHFSANGGLILNRAYSHFEMPSDNQGHFSREETSPLGSDVILSGFWCGLNTLLGKGQRKLVVGLSVAHTEYQYKYISTDSEPYFSSRFPSAYRTSNSNVDVYGRLLALNFELGLKRQLFYPFSISHLFIIQSTIKRTEKVTGNLSEYWYNNYSNFSYSETTPINQKITNIDGTRSQNNLACYRLVLFVKVKYRKSTFEAMVFRNFALSRRTSVPLWGIGINYHLGKPDDK